MGVTTSIGTNSYSSKAASAYYYYYNRNLGNSFYGLTRPMYSSETYYSLSNNNSSTGGRLRRPMLRINNTDNYNISVRFM
jgi:hypothetical protein